jgi:hypothetical protein
VAHFGIRNKIEMKIPFSILYFPVLTKITKPFPCWEFNLALESQVS